MKLKIWFINTFCRIIVTFKGSILEYSCVKVQKFGENCHFRSGVIFTPEVRMEHVDRHWKAYPTENSGESLESE